MAGVANEMETKPSSVSTNISQLNSSRFRNITTLSSIVDLSNAKSTSTQKLLLEMISTSSINQRSTVGAKEKYNSSTEVGHRDSMKTSFKSTSTQRNPSTETTVTKLEKKDIPSKVLEIVTTGDSLTSAEITSSTTSMSTQRSIIKTVSQPSHTLDISSSTIDTSSTEQLKTTGKLKSKTSSTIPAKNPKILSTTTESTRSTSTVKATFSKRNMIPSSTRKTTVALRSERTNVFFSTQSQYSTNDLYLGSTKEPAQSIGAGALVIVVLLPFLALFLIAVVTALRRKMKKSSRRTNRYQNRKADAKLERNQSQMIPLTRSDETDT